MLNRIFKVCMVLLLAGFSFFYTEKVTKIARNKDPIMVQINDYKYGRKVSSIDPTIKNDEYITGKNGCEVDSLASYNKMKSVGEFKEELIVMKEITSNDDISNKYVIGGNKKEKNISIIFFVHDNINNELVDFLNNKKIIANFFIDGEYLEKNLITVKFLSENSNIYYMGINDKYDDDYMLYHNNLISMNGTNESKYCFVNDKNNETLKLCSDYGMVTIKSNVIKDGIYKYIKSNLNNGAIFAINDDKLDEIKVSINYILSKGYNIVSLEKLLNESNECN